MFRLLTDRGLHCFVSPMCPKTKIVLAYNTLKIMHNILKKRNILTLFMEVKKILAVFLEFSSILPTSVFGVLVNSLVREICLFLS